MQYFSWDGRLGRWDYFKVSLVCTLVNMALGSLAEKGLPLAMHLLLLIGCFFAVWASLAASVKRCRDTGFSPWMVLLFFVPLANLVFGLVLLFKPSKGA